VGQRSASFSVRGGRCWRVGRDIAVDTVCFERLEIAFAAVAESAEACSGLRPRLFSMALIRGTAGLIAAALRQFVRTMIWAPRVDAAWAL